MRPDEEGAESPLTLPREQDSFAEAIPFESCSQSLAELLIGCVRTFSSCSERSRSHCLARSRQTGCHNDVEPRIAVLLVTLAAMFSVAGTVIAAVTAEKRRQDIEVDMLTAVRATLVPVALRFIGMERPIDGRQLEEALTGLTLHCRAFVSSDGIDSDANYYRLDGNELTCVNRRAGTARERFTKSRHKSPVEVEESAVIDRLLQKEAAVCSDTWSKRERRRLTIADTRRTYRSFVSVPAIDGSGRARRMLSVNSSKKRAFGQLHVVYLNEMARMILALEDAS